MIRRLVVLVLVAMCGAARAAPEVRYRVTIDDVARARSLPLVTIELGAAPAPLELSFAAWLPGAYELRWFGRDVIALEAHDAEGHALTIERHGPTRITIRGHAAGAPVTVRYRIAAALLSDDGADVDEEHAYLNPGAIVPLVRGFEERDASLALDVPSSWKSVLPRIDAHGYLPLIDQPLEAADPRALMSEEVVVAGTRFSIVVHADPASRARVRQQLPAVAKELARVAEAERRLAGAFPFSRYTVLMHLSERAGRLAALEHAAAASIVASPHLFDKDGVSELRHVLSHELFHAWNARRIVAAELVGVDLEQIRPSASLWITEGLTEHAALVALGASGLAGHAEITNALEEAFTRARLAEGAHASLSTLAQLAFTSPSTLAADPDAYYAVGHVVSLAIVALLLERTDGRIGLEQLLSALLPPQGAPARAIDTAGLGAVLDRLAPPGPEKKALSAILDEWVERPWATASAFQVLRSAGLRIEETTRSRLDTAVLADGTPPVLSVLEPGGAYVRAGAQRGDRVLRIDGEPASLARIVGVATASVTTPVTLEIVRGGDPLTLRLEPRLVEDPRVRVIGGVDAQSRLRARLLGTR